MDTIAGIFSPPLFASLCGVAVGAAAILFVLSRRGEGAILDLRVPLSWAEPAEVRLVIYLLLAAACGAGALILRLFVSLTTSGSFIGWLLLVVVFFEFLGTLAFFYAAAGCLLQAALGSRGRVPFFFSPILAILDGAVMDVGDAVARVLFTPAPVRSRRRDRERERYDLDFDSPYEDEMPRRRPSGGAAPRRPAARRAAADYDDVAEVADEYALPIEGEVATRRARGVRRGPPRDLLRERLDRAIEDYEDSLTPVQLEKLRVMRSLLESLRECS